MTSMMIREYLAAELGQAAWHSSAPRSQGCWQEPSSLERTRSEEWPGIQGLASSPRLAAAPSSLELPTAAWVCRLATDSAARLCPPCSFAALWRTLALSSTRAFIQLLILLLAGWLWSPLVL